MNIPPRIPGFGGDVEYGWKATGDYYPDEAKKARPFFPRIIHALKLIPMITRLFLFCVKEWLAGRGSFINMLQQMRHDPFTGVPIGGIGCGSIGTDFRGGFNKFSLIPGIKEQTCQNIKANQFILTVRDAAGDCVFWSLLSCADFKDTVLEDWDQTFDKTDVRYRGLFPRAWREFSIEALNLFVFMRQMSPVIPNDYEDTSLPVTNFRFFVVNQSERDYEVSITFTWRNGTGNPKWEKESTCRSSEIHGEGFRGCLLKNSIKDMPVIYAICAAKTDHNTVTASWFDPTGSGSTIRNYLERSGCLSGDHTMTATELAVAVCSKSCAPSRMTTEHCFSLVWDMPEIQFGLKNRTYQRRYTRFFSGPNAAVKMTEHVFAEWRNWEAAIEKWQQPVLNDHTLPNWFKSALFNELYYVVDGSTVWVEYDDGWLNRESNMSSHTQEWFKKYGRFAYMESWEYYMYSTYDVHFYASWALLQNWPALELGIQYDFTDQFYRYDGDKVQSMFTGEIMDRKKYAKTPHDLGHPMGEPWYQTNAYQLHDSSHWRDLNLKLVPMCWRDWRLIVKKMEHSHEARRVLEYFYTRCRFLVDQALSEWDIDDDDMIENSGSADQTYDVWTMTGTSAYCGSLWLCAVSCIAAMAEELGNDEACAKYRKILKNAAEAYEKKLYNQWYYKFDENPKNELVIMADQLCGIWFLSMIKAEQPLKEYNVRMTLNVLHSLNGYSFENGQFGPVNGYKQHREVDTSCVQSEEVWTGVAYALGSFFLTKGRRKEAFEVTRGIYESCWRRFGLQWQTPEAITSRLTYRAIGYMRPLSIWSMHYALFSLNEDDQQLLEVRDRPDSPAPDDPFGENLPWLQ